MNHSQSQQSKLSTKWAQSSNDLHMLYSMLPTEYQLFKKRQLKKTKQFYHPEQCIWNNAYRTSERLYKYYHQGNDQYRRVKEPMVAKLEQEDRQNVEVERILRLAKKREEVRAKFEDKKMLRMKIEQKAGIKRTTSNQLLSSRLLLSSHNQIQSNRNLFQPMQQLTLKRSNSETGKKSSGSATKCVGVYKKLKTNQQEGSNAERSFLCSVQNFDLKNRATLELLKHSGIEMKKRIRQNFTKQKQNNAINQSSTFFKTKLLKPTFCKNAFTKTEPMDGENSRFSRFQFEK